ncbi:hypothetical protein ABT150_53395 [Streptomyces mirabilis]|uniref:hypothetical protein n=1 Tax=Streptomyces mirabilis TaxID=68239 RepID=UPI00332E82D9
MIKNRERILRASETGLTYLTFLVSAKGNRKEAANAAAEADKAVTDLLQARPGKIRKQDAQGVWCPASDALALRSWLWFLIAVLLGVGSLLLMPSSPTAEQYVRIAISLVPAVPSALFASRQMGHALAERALRTGTAEPSALTWIGRWLSEGAVFVLTVGIWPLWMTVLVI